jgi:glycosyltransferase involved in cell wall biosynthesis
LDEIKPDAVAVPGWGYIDALAALQWSLLHRVPVVCMSDSMARDERRRWWKEIVKRRFIRCYSAALVAGTPHADYLVHLGMSADWIFQGYDAVDNEYFAQGAKEVRSQKSEVRRRCGLPEKYFLVPRRFIWEKNLARLLEAYALYRKKSEARSQKSEVGKTKIWDLVLVGDGPLQSSILNFRSSLGLDACVHMPGFKQYKELPDYYGLASTVILPSVSETWGLVVNEAMASGLPVLVSSRCGCAKDLVQEGVNGFTFDPFNVEELAELMLKVSAVNFPLSAFGSQSQRIISNWGPERFAAGLKSAVDKAIEVGPVKPTLVQKLILKALLAR